MKVLRKFLGYKFILNTGFKKNRNTREKITSLLRYANEHTPFYKGHFDLFLQSAASLSDAEFFYAYSHLPIATKQHLRDENESFMSEPLLHKTELMKDGKIPAVKNLIMNGLIKKNYYTTLSTGGSSGVPTYRWLDYDDANVFAQSFLESFKCNGWSEGEDFVVFYPLKSYFTGAYADNQKPLSQLFGFTMVPFETVTKESVNTLLQALRDTNATLLVIFPCVLQRVAEIMHEEGIAPLESLKYINVSGEFFLDCSKTFIQSMFPNSDIQSTYGAVEFGEVAHQSGSSSFDYDVFDDYVYMEQGPQNSMLVTALHQKSFPLIRYQIQDLGQVITDEDGKQHIRHLEGKNEDFLVGADGYLYFASFFNGLINAINKDCDNAIIHFMLRHKPARTAMATSWLQANIVLKDKSKEGFIYDAMMYELSNVFANYHQIEVTFRDHFDHDYTRKFKIIGEGDGLAEVVGGYYQREAS